MPARDVVQDARPERELRLDALLMQAHGDVGLEEDVLPLGVRHPVDEERAATLEIELTSARERALGLLHDADVGVRMADAEEHALDVGSRRAQAVQRLEQRERIEPVPEPARPEHDFVVAADAGEDAFQRVARVHRRHVGDAERHDREQTLEAAVVDVVGVVQPPRGREHAEPEAALRLARAQKEVAVLEMMLQPA